MKHLTVRRVPPAVAKALQRERSRLGLSLNGTILALLGRALGLSHPEGYRNGLASHAGSWSEDDLRRFEADTALFEGVDPELWE